MDLSTRKSSSLHKTIYPISRLFARVNIIFSLFAEFAFVFLCNLHNEMKDFMTIRCMRLHHFNKMLLLHLPALVPFQHVIRLKQGQHDRSNRVCEQKQKRSV